MKVLNYMSGDSWLPALAATSQHDLFEVMLGAIYGADEGVGEGDMDLSEVLLALESREEQLSTALGHGVAFPHARLSNLKTARVALGVLQSPILFGEQPTSIVCLILSPADEPTVSLKIMSQFSRMLMDETKRQAVLTARTADALRAIVAREDLRIDQPILARDIMRAPGVSVPPDTPINKVAQLMSSAHLFVVPVLSDEGRILGDITTDNLFRYGLPDFFTQLKSISFIAEFEPFEAYFKAERSVLAGELIEKAAGIVPMHYTLMEIVFDLAIRHVPQLYVVDAKERWVGTIDHGVVLHNVINY
ncbi:MAG: PTS sugar transporter subunit IIA [Lentisphaerae bacterium]|nr:PTS sugar transporter subunit IIA [Lentisphaerota bacterium]